MTTTSTEKATKPAAARRRASSRATRGAAAAQPKPATASKAPAKSTPKSTPKPEKRAPEPKAPTTTAKRTAVMNAMIVASADLIDPKQWAATMKRFPALAELNVSREEATEYLSARLSYAPADAWDSRLNPPKELKGRKIKTV